MAFEDIKPKRRPDVTEPAADDDNFYETMPLMAAPHAIYRDDGYVSSDEELELARQRSRLIALVTLSLITIVSFGLIIAIGFGLASLNTATTPVTGSGSSLEL